MPPSLFLEDSVAVELHQRLDAAAEGRAAARHRRGLDRLEQLALGRAVLDRSAHVGDDALVPAAIGQDADDDHLAMLDGELFAFADRQGTQRPARLDVLGIFLGHPVPEWIAVGAGGLAVDLLAHRTLLARRATRQEGIT